METKTGNLKTKKRSGNGKYYKTKNFNAVFSGFESQGPRRAVFEVQGPVTTSFEVGGGAKFGCSLFLAVWNCQITELFLSHC